jgi:hypothetical protein
MNRNAEFARDAARHEREWGIITPQAMDYLPEEFKSDWSMALDAQPSLVTQPNSGIPFMYTSYMEPEVIRIFQTPNKGASIYGEQKKGSWVDQTAFFPVIENTGEVSSYSDFNTNGRSDANANWVQRQSYLFQTFIEYGELEEDRAGAAKLAWLSELQISAAKTLDKFMDFTYHFGVAGLENYGVLNDPSLSAVLTPSTKAFTGSGTKWVFNGAVTATSNEVYGDIQTMYQELSVQSGGLIDEDTAFVLVVPNTVNAGLTATNSFGLTVRALIKESFPNFEIIVDPRYATTAGNVVQLIAKSIDGKQTGYCAFNEKMRDHRLVPAESSFRQKKTAGTWGGVIRYPLAVAQMLGV